MTIRGADEPTSVALADFELLRGLVLDVWASGLDRDWTVPAGTLDWSCLRTADHVVDCVFSYALFLGSRKQDGYPNFGELHALPGATARDLLDGLRAVTTMLAGVIAIAPPDATAVIWRRPAPTTGTPADFAARGSLEMVLHAHDVCAGLGLAFEPPAEPCARLLARTDRWPGNEAITRGGDPWADLLRRSGRPPR